MYYIFYRSRRSLPHLVSRVRVRKRKFRGTRFIHQQNGILYYSGTYFYIKKKKNPFIFYGRGRAERRRISTLGSGTRSFLIWPIRIFRVGINRHSRYIIQLRSALTAVFWRKIIVKTTRHPTLSVVFGLGLADSICRFWSWVLGDLLLVYLLSRKNFPSIGIVQSKCRIKYVRFTSILII